MPNQAWLDRLTAESIKTAAPYSIDAFDVDVKLDQNENPYDLPVAIKQKVVDKLLAKPWNRYPPAFADDLADQLAARDGVARGCACLSPGSNILLTWILDVFCRTGLAVVARPSFPLYEQYCRTSGIAYAPWPLSQRLTYDVDALPTLQPGSVVLFASPNNPVGNVLPRTTLAGLLRQHPDVLFVADEAYFEFAPEPYTPLLANHANLILVRTFSKTMGAAGARIGYLLAAAPYIALLRRWQQPFQLNQFAVALADVMLNEPGAAAFVSESQAEVLSERTRVASALGELAARHGFEMFPTAANFNLVRWPSNAAATAVYNELIQRGVLVRNVSGAPMLTGCLRITIGRQPENSRLLKALADIHKGTQKMSAPTAGPTVRAP